MKFRSKLEDVPTTTPATLTQRIRAGMDRARQRGAPIGRPRAKLDERRIRTLAAQGYSYAEIATQVGADKMTVYRRLTA